MSMEASRTTVGEASLAAMLPEQPFRELPAEGMQELEEMITLRQFPDGSLLFLEGTTPSGVFIVRSGRVKLSVSSRRGRQMILQIAGPGEILGLGASISGHDYEVTAQAMAPVEALFLPRKKFLRYLQLHPNACVPLTRILSDELEDAYERVRSLRQF